MRSGKYGHYKTWTRRNYQMLPGAPSKDRLGEKKLYPKSSKYIGTVSACPVCGLKGQLYFKFAYDGCLDVSLPRQSMKVTHKKLGSGEFHVLHRGKHHTHGRDYLGTCMVPWSDFYKLDGLLLHDRKVPEEINRELLVERFGRGYDRFGVKHWEPVKV